jgi:membrane protein involved in D-alanine export
MVPFANVTFFYVLFLMLLVIWTAKIFLKDRQYKFVLLFLNGAFFLLYFTQPIHFTLYIIWAYFFTYFFTNVLVLAQRIWGILILLAPMLLVKFDIRQDGYHLNTLISFAGLSYASFKAMGYFMDRSYKEKMVDPVTYFNFLAFTPTLLIGPINRLSHFKESQDKGFSNITWENSLKASDYFVLGVAFKYVGAELVDRYWLNLYPESSTDFLHMANTMYAYYLYLFFDFAGYSFMALGTAKFMGIVVPQNFRNPFFVRNSQEFWHTFHVSLGDWLKAYFFTPLYTFLTRKKSLKKYPVFRQNTALFLTFLLMGCWNGFQKHFILSGALFGFISIVHNWYSIQCRKKQKDILFGTLPDVWVKWISIFIMWNVVAFALFVFSGKAPFIHA